MGLPPVAQELFDQMGGRRLTAMAGALFCGIRGGMGLMIELPPETSNGVKCVEIVLDKRTDTYDVVFRKRLADSKKLEPVYETGIHFDSLQELFTRHTGFDIPL